MVTAASIWSKGRPDPSVLAPAGRGALFSAASNGAARSRPPFEDRGRRIFRSWCDRFHRHNCYIMLNGVPARYVLWMEDVMSWTSDRAWMTAEAALLSLVVLLWIYIPA
jgi:hypothetical protein